MLTTRRTLPNLLLSASLVAGVTAACSKKTEPSSKATGSAEAAVAVPSGHPVDAMRLTKSLGSMTIPKDNPQTDAKIELGHLLFFDQRLSVDGTRACYSCHQNEDGNGGHDPIAVGAKEVSVGIHSPVIWNVGYLQAYYWNGRAPTLEAQATAAWAGANMGVGKDGLEAKAKEIGSIPGYAERFAKVFPDQGATPETIVQAIAAYERTLICDDTAYDRWLKGDKEALTTRQKDGLELFLGQAGCSSCHAPPHFSIAYSVPNGAYFNVGIGIEGKAEKDVDVGRFKVTEKQEDWAAFKPPTLRNVSRSAPYFHDGSVKSLEQAVRFMASGGYPNKNRSTLLEDRKLTDQQIQALVEFLKALDCGKKLEEPELPGK